MRLQVQLGRIVIPLAALLLGSLARLDAAPLTWTLSEFQPNIQMGGRANTIAVDPATPDHLIVASDTGGLFTSTDAGVTWAHVESLREFATRGVAFHPRHPAIVLASVSGEYDYRQPGGGGIWRSTDGGGSWTQVLGAGLGAGDSLSAWEIAYGESGHVFVGTSEGLAFSQNDGVTWQLLHPFPTGVQGVFAVALNSKGFVFAAGPQGVAVSKSGGQSWSRPTTPLRACWDMHALATSVLDPLLAFYVDDVSGLFVTEDGGDTWAAISGAPMRPADSGCGGIAFIKAKRLRAGSSARRLALYYGNRCATYRAGLNAEGGRKYSYDVSWTELKDDHDDSRDIAFNSRSEPILLASDGGLHRTSDLGATWTLAGGGWKGLNALQITEVQSQRVGSSGVRDLYFGTQDNWLWASADDGVTWGSAQCCEGFFIEAQYRVDQASDSLVTYTACGACATFRSGRLFDAPQPWVSPSGGASNDPKRFGFKGRLQGVDTTGILKKGLAITFDNGATWSQFAAFDEARRDLPKASEWIVFPVVYQTIRTTFDATLGASLEKLVAVKSSIVPPFQVTTFPAMRDFGSLGILPTQFAWYSVYGVDAGDTKHLIAPDVVKGHMAESRDGGESWAAMPQLTGLVTANGAFRFARGIFPQVTAVSFCPTDPRFVAVGTMQAGVFISADNGDSWTKVNGSERTTYVTAIEWLSPVDLVVATYGRGLWRVRRPLIPPAPVTLCRDCKPLSAVGATGAPAWTILAAGGAILGGTLVEGRLTELSVSPGTLLAAFGDEVSELPRTKVVKHWTGFEGGPDYLATAPHAPLVSLSLGRDGAVVAAATAERGILLDSVEQSLGERTRPLEAAPPHIDFAQERTESPTHGRPYIHLLGVGARGAVAVGQPVALAGRGFTPGAELVVALDGTPGATVRADATGGFTEHLAQPGYLGVHVVEVKDVRGNVLDGVQFLVAASDRKPECPASRPGRTCCEAVAHSEVRELACVSIHETTAGVPGGGGRGSSSDRLWKVVKLG